MEIILIGVFHAELKYWKQTKASKVTIEKTGHFKNLTKTSDCSSWKENSCGEEQHVLLMHKGPKQHSAWVKQQLTVSGSIID